MHGNLQCKKVNVDNEPASVAVERLIREYSKLVFHTIYGLTGDWEESQDLTQETFQQALKSIDAARAKSGAYFHEKAWLLQIAMNTVRMQKRRSRVFHFIPFSRLERNQPGQPPASSDSPYDSLEEQAAPVQPSGYSAPRQPDLETLVAERDAVQRTLRRISPPLRECLLLSVIGQFSAAEIAPMLGIEEAAVRQRIARARKQFQQIYAQMGGEELIETRLSPGTSMSQNRSDMHHSNVESHLSRLLS
jgi:RNA polymerase sigma-70 factor (ECF subfamily)